MLSLPNSILAAAVLIAVALMMPLLLDRYQPAGTFVIDGMPGLYRMNPRTGAIVPCVLLHVDKPATDEPVEKYFVQCR